MRRLIVFFDGTWQYGEQRFDTNVAKICQLTATANPRVGQILFYQHGVGAKETFLPTMAKIWNGAVGAGIEAKLSAAYEFLAANYRSGDRIYIFGFSRGAYTANCLAGMLSTCGLLQPAYLRLTPVAFSRFRASGQNTDSALNQFRRAYCHNDSLRIDYLGLWDMVGARGLPRSLPFSRFWNRRYDWQRVGLPSSVARGRHAVSIDEDRSTFAPTLWPEGKLSGDGPIQQKWFAGDHGHVGGGHELSGLSNVALRWVLEGAVEAGLECSDAWKALVHQCNPRTPIDGRVLRRNSLLWRFLRSISGRSARQPPPRREYVHESVWERTQTLPGYRPAQLEGMM